MSARPPLFPRRAVFVATLAACLALAAPCAGAADITLDELMARLQARPHRHDTFTERFTTRILDRALESSGELFYDAPARLEKRTLAPRPERLLLEHDVLTVERHKRTYHATLAEYPQLAPYIDSIRATLAGERAGLERLFHVTFRGTGADWSLLLAPLQASTVAAVREIEIAGTLDTVRTVLIERANGDRSLMTLTGVATP
jgi:Outer membrane lipoprotein carrier protein LolA-like